ncbi:hypothetical protein Tco_0884316 [Tanacetum coccineum]
MDAGVESTFEADKVSKQPVSVSRSNEDTGTHGFNRKHDGLPRSPYFASFLQEESNKRKVNFRTLEMKQIELADVLIPMLSVLEVQFEYTLYGYFLGMKVAFLVVDGYILNSWKKYGVTRDGLSAIATRLGTPIILYLCNITQCMQSWERMNYARTLVDIMVDQALKDTMVISVPNPIGNGARGNQSLPKKQMPKSAYQKMSDGFSSSATSTPVFNVFFALGVKDDTDPQLLM